MHTQRFQWSEDLWIAWHHIWPVRCTLDTCTPYNSYIPRTHSQWGEALWITCHQVLCPKADKKCSLTAEYCKLSVGVFGVSSHPLWILTAAAAAILQAGFWVRIAMVMKIKLLSHRWFDKGGDNLVIKSNQQCTWEMQNIGNLTKYGVLLGSIADCINQSCSET